MARKSKADKAIERICDDAAHAAFKRHSHGAQINVMNLGKVLDAGRDALRAGQSVDDAMIAAVAQYRQN